MSEQLHWTLKPFNELRPKELYAIMQLRIEVFIVEQNCVFQDADDKDHYCQHLMGWAGDELAAYARIVPPEISYTEPSIGRIITSPKHRGTGAGKALVSRAIDMLEGIHGVQPIRIGAQLYLEKFYESFGFVSEGDVYLEDGIDHIIMVRP